MSRIGKLAPLLLLCRRVSKNLSIYTLTSDPSVSFGRVTHSLAACFRRLGYSVSISEDRKAEYFVAVDGPSSVIKTKHLLTFWETTELHPPDVACLKMQARTRKIHVTCQQAMDVLGQYNIKSSKIPLAAEYAPCVLAPFKPFTFYTIYQDAGYWERKRAQDVVDAFELAFPKIPDVKLIAKQNPNCKELVTFDKRIEVIRQSLTSVKHLHEQGHVFVSACGAEGWGYPHHDAIAHGRPVICQKIGGPLEFLDGTCAWFVKPYMHKAPKGIYSGMGKIGHVNVKELAAAMRYAYDNKVEVMEKSVAAFQRARHFTLDQMTVAVKNAFKL